MNDERNCDINVKSETCNCMDTTGGYHAEVKSDLVQMNSLIYGP